MILAGEALRKSLHYLCLSGTIYFADARVQRRWGVRDREAVRLLCDIAIVPIRARTRGSSLSSSPTRERRRSWKPQPLDDRPARDHRTPPPVAPPPCSWAAASPG